MAANTVGLNQTFPIKNADGTPFYNLVLHKSAYENVVMSLGDKITGDVYYKDNKLVVTMHEYIEFNDVHFVLVNPPTIVREGMVADNSALRGMTKYSFTFYHPMYLLGNFPFADVAVSQDEKKYLSESKKFSWIGYPDDFIAKLNKNLDGTEWMVVKSERFPEGLDDKLSEVQQFDGATIADALKRGYEIWGVPYIVDKVVAGETGYSVGKRFKVIFGLPFSEIYEDASHEQLDEPYVFQMGQGVGLKNNSRTPRNNKIITRIAGYGSEDNVPYGYPQIPWYGDSRWDYTAYQGSTINYDAEGKVTNTPAANAYPLYMGIVGGAYVKLIKHPFTRSHLMPSVYSSSVFNKVSPYNSDGTANTNYNPDTTLVDYYDAISDQEHQYPNPIVANAPSYDIHEFEDVKPELDSDREMGIIAAVPLNQDLTPASSWDDTMDDDGNYIQSYFKVTLPALGFDIYACAAITQEMQINMRSGACLGCTFEAQVDWDDYKKNFYTDDGTFAPSGSQRDYGKYPDSTSNAIDLVLKKETSTFGTLMPNVYQYPVSGDIFVIIGISLPLTYIGDAEERLDEEMKSYMLENNVHYYDYPLKFDEFFLRGHQNILTSLKPNSIVHFVFGNETLQLYVKQITIKYGESTLPQYDITLTDNIEVVLNQIGQVSDDVEKLSSLISILRQNYSRNVWMELSKKLSKTQDDTAQGFIRMLQGIQVGANYVPDILGEGGVFRKDSDGKIVLVTDKLYARVKAYFDSVEIKDYKHTSGNRIASKAGIKCTHVEWLDASGNVLEQTSANESGIVKFRCYFRAKDGTDSITNDFVASATGQQDLAFCDKTSMDAGINQRRYWRAVVGKNGTLGEDDEFGYIDLSKSDCEDGSDFPMAEDDIIQLGNKTDNDRQGAIIEYVGGTDAPSYQIYQGINTYSLANKNYISFGYSSQTGRAYMNVYGDFRFGNASDNGSYIKYNAGSGQLDIRARIDASSPVVQDGTTYNDMQSFVEAHSSDWTQQQIDALIHGITDPIQAQVDGAIDTWYYSGVPTLNNAPANQWTTDTEKDKHIGDLYYDKATGHGYRFMYDDDNDVYVWTVLADEDVTEALRIANEAYDTADGKRTIYSEWNAWMDGLTNKLQQGDLFIPTSNTTQSGTTYYARKVYKCTTDATATFEEINYTDDSAFNGYISALLNGTGSSGDAATAAAVQKAISDALGGGTIVDGGLLLTSLIAMRKYNASTQQYTTWAGISGLYKDSETGTGYKGHGIAAWYGGAMVDKEVSTTATDYAKSLFRFDGSGYLASGNITWDKNGIVTIANVYSDVNGTPVAWSGATLQYMTNLATLLPITVIGSTTYLDPQVGFKQLSVLGKTVATQEWVGQNYVSKTFFNAIFQLEDSNGNVITPNNATTAKNRLKILVGAYTDQYLSALGLNPNSGGGGGATALADLTDVTLTSPTQNQILVFNGTHWVNQNQQSLYVLPAATSSVLGGIKIGYSASGKNYAVQLDANNNAFVNVPWTDTTYTLAGLMGSSAIGGATQPIYWNGSAFVNTTYTLGKSVPSDAVFTDTNTWRNILLAGTQKLGNGTDTKGLNFVGDGKTTISFLAAGTGSGTSGSSNYATIQISSTWRGIQDNLTSDSTTDSLSAKQGKTLYGYITTLQGHFTNGVANSAAKLSTVNKTAWGQTYWTSGGVPDSISGDMSSVGNISFAASGKNIGGLIYFDTTNSRVGIGTTSPSYKLDVVGSVHVSGNTIITDGQAKIGSSIGNATYGYYHALYMGYHGIDHMDFYESMFNFYANGGGSGATINVSYINTSRLYLANGVYLEYNSSNGGVHLVGAGFYSDSFVSALGLNSSGGGGGGGATALYGLLDVLANSVGTAVDGASAGNVLTFDGTAGKWKGVAPNNGALYLQASGTTKATFTANQSGQSTFNIAEGSANGTISVGGTNVAVHGLGSRAYDSTAYLPLSGGIINANNAAAPLILKGGLSGYREGLRIIPYGNWSDILLAGTDASEASGTSANSWFIGNNNGNFYITRNGSTSGDAVLSCVNNVWYANENTIIHSGNIGSQSVSYATSAGSCSGNSMTATRFAYITDWNSPPKGANVINLMTDVSSSATTNGAPSRYTSGISIVTSYVGFQLASYGGGGEDLYFRKLQDNNTWHSWYTIVHSGNIGSQSVSYATSAGSCSGNSATATQLQTARTIWGQSFDGSANVSGAITDATSITYSGNILNSTCGLRISDRSNISSTGNAIDAWIAHSHSESDSRTVIFDSNYVVLYPKVRIGDYSTSAAPSYTLDVSGGISLSGSIYMGGANWRTITVERTNVGAGNLGGIDGNGMYFYHQVSGGSSSYMYLKGGVGLSVNGNISTSSSNGSYVKIGALYLSYDSTNNALRVSANANGTGAANFYAIGAVSALGANTGGGGGSATSLYELLDVTANSGGSAVEGASGGNVLTYDSSTSKWKGKALENLSFYVYTKNTVGTPVSPTNVYNGKTAVTLNLASADAFVKATISGKTLKLFPANAGGNLAAAVTLTTQDTWKAASTSQEGYVPKLDARNQATLGANDLVIAFNGTSETKPSWKALPSSVFGNQVSDIRKKDVINYDVCPSIDAVANAPTIRFTWKDKRDEQQHVGSIAQYWQTVLPETVGDIRGELTMNYGTIALLASIATAKKVQDHEREIERLKNRISELEYQVEQLNAA